MKRARRAAVRRVQERGMEVAAVRRVLLALLDVVRLAEVPPSLLGDVIKEAWQHVATLPPKRRR